MRSPETLLITKYKYKHNESTLPNITKDTIKNTQNACKKCVITGSNNIETRKKNTKKMETLIKKDRIILILFWLNRVTMKSCIESQIKKNRNYYKKRKIGVNLISFKKSE